jgi:hypothetical protein
MSLWGWFPLRGAFFSTALGCFDWRRAGPLRGLWRLASGCLVCRAAPCEAFTGLRPVPVYRRSLLYLSCCLRRPFCSLREASFDCRAAPCTGLQEDASRSSCTSSGQRTAARRPFGIPRAREGLLLERPTPVRWKGGKKTVSDNRRWHQRRDRYPHGTWPFH